MKETEDWIKRRVWEYKQDPNVERYVQERIKPLQEQIKELQAAVFKLMQANNLHLQNVSRSVCPICKKEFETGKGHGDYCSYDCWDTD